MKPVQPAAGMVKTFDYAALDGQTRKDVEQRTGEIRGLMRRAARDILDIGQKLIEVKRKLPHGAFLPWLEAEFGWSERSARNYMAAAEAFGGKSAIIADLAPTVLCALAAPSTPEAARVEAMERASQGERVGVKAAREIIDRHREEKNSTATSNSIPAPASQGGASANGSQMAGQAKLVDPLHADEDEVSGNGCQMRESAAVAGQGGAAVYLDDPALADEDEVAVNGKASVYLVDPIHADEDEQQSGSGSDERPLPVPRLARPALDGPLKYHGGKSPLAEWIISRMVPHRHYVEPFAGSLAVLLARDPEGVSEVVCDKNLDLTNFWRVLQDEETFDRFARRMQATPFSQVEYDDAVLSLREQKSADPVMRACWFFTICRQSLAGRMNGFTPLTSSRTRRGMSEQASAWWTAIDGLAEVHARLARVVIKSGEALEVIRSQDSKDTLFYCDPPYPGSTRSAPLVYAHEMSEAQHRELLLALCHVKGKVVISGYPSPLYDGMLTRAVGWRRHEKEAANHAAGGASKRRMTECLWCNF